MNKASKGTKVEGQRDLVKTLKPPSSNRCPRPVYNALFSCFHELTPDIPQGLIVKFRTVWTDIAAQPCLLVAMRTMQSDRKCLRRVSSQSLMADPTQRYSYRQWWWKSGPRLVLRLRCLKWPTLRWPGLIDSKITGKSTRASLETKYGVHMQCTEDLPFLIFMHELPQHCPSSSLD